MIFMSETHEYEPAAEFFFRPPVIKYSEMMAYVKYPDGRREKLVEIGNPRYREVEQLIVINPDGSFAFQTKDGRKEFPPETRFEILHDLGFIGSEDLLKSSSGSGSIILSEGEYYRRLAELYRLTKDKIAIVQSVAKVAGLRIPGDYEFDQVLLDLIRRVRLTEKRRELEKNEKDVKKVNRIMEEIQRRNFFPSPEEMAKGAVDVILDFNQEIVGTDIEERLLDLKRNPILYAKNEKEMKDYIVSFFYFYSMIKNRQTLSENQDVLEDLRNFPFQSWLLDEYERRSDGRFGDSLLVACSELSRELKTAE